LLWHKKVGASIQKRLEEKSKLAGNRLALRRAAKKQDLRPHVTAF